MKRLVFCFDGSWNRLDAKYPTNVVFTAENIRPTSADGVVQYVFYDDGVGTDGDKFVGGVFGAGLLKNLADAYRALIFNHTPGDEIYVFGFSRGAFTARSFAGLISTCGILQRIHASRANEAVELYKSRDDSLHFRAQVHLFRSDYAPDVCVSPEEDAWRAANVAGYQPGQAPLLSIRYIGVWDTVGALGIPKYIWAAQGFNKQYQFHDTKLSAFVHYARHAVAIDERRVDFEPTLWDNLDELNASRGTTSAADAAPYQQKWFPGVHGAVGGGGDRRGLSDAALEWIWEGAQAAGLEFNAESQREFAPSFRDYLANNSAPLNSRWSGR